METRLDQLRSAYEAARNLPEFAGFDWCFERSISNDVPGAFVDAFSIDRAGRITVWEEGFANIEVLKEPGGEPAYLDAYDAREEPHSIPAIFQLFLRALSGEDLPQRRVDQPSP